MKVDFAAVKTIPIASVLAHYNVETRKRNNTELVANCPFPSHKESEHKWTLAISTHKNKWFCHSDTCRAASNKPKGGDVIDLVCLLDNCLPLEAAKKLSDLFCVGREGEAAKECIAPSAAESSTGNKPLAFELRGIQHEHPFIQARGITPLTANEFGVGFFPGKGSMAGRVVFPLYENGAIVGYAGRATNGDEPKWKMPLGLVKSFLYGLERCDPAKPLILLESFWGVLWFWQNKIQACALMGSSMTPEQEKLLEPFAEIRIALLVVRVRLELTCLLMSAIQREHALSWTSFGTESNSGSGKPLILKKIEMEARVGVEPTYKGFADLCLTTWLPRRKHKKV